MKNHMATETGDTLTVDCFGVLDSPSVLALLELVRESLKNKLIRRAIVITNNAPDCSESAKKELVVVQRELAEGRRTAWVDERARFRGIALWVMHLAGDSQGKAVSTVEQAQRWLDSSEAREVRGQRMVVP